MSEKAKEPQREPIKVGTIRLKELTSGPPEAALSGAPNTITHHEINGQNTHGVEFWPWLRSFRIFHKTGKGVAFFITEDKVLYWVDFATYRDFKESNPTR